MTIPNSIFFGIPGGMIKVSIHVKERLFDELRPFCEIIPLIQGM